MKFLVLGAGRLVATSVVGSSRVAPTSRFSSVRPVAASSNATVSASRVRSETCHGRYEPHWPIR